MKKSNVFNLVITGVGGQGLITLLNIVSEAALLAGLDVKTSELHGLSQRGGSVEVHVRFVPQKKSDKHNSHNTVFSPLVRQGGADLIISLDLQEAQRACYYAGKKTCFLINNFTSQVIKGRPVTKNKALGDIKKFSKKIVVIPATDICQEKMGKDVTAGVFLLSFASFKGMIPLKPQKVLEAMEEIIPARYLKINKDTFNLSEEYLKEF